MDRVDARFNEASCDFMLADIETAHAFLDVAQTSESTQARLDTQKARELLSAVTLCLVNATVEPARRSKIEKGLRELRARLDSSSTLVPEGSQVCNP